MKAIKKADNQSLTLIAILAIILSVGGVYLWLIPRIKLVRQELENKRAIEGGLIKDIAELQQIQAALSEGQTALIQRGISLSSITSVVPDTEDIPGLYIQLEELMRSSGLSQNGYQIGAPISDLATAQVKVPVTITVTGKYAQLKAFLTRLEQNLRPISFTALNFVTPTPGSVGAGPGQITLTAVGYARAQSLSASYSSASVK